MRGLRSILAVALALVLAASAAVHGARAAGMTMPMATAWSIEAAAPCDLCGGGTGVEATAQCALACAGLAALLGEDVLLRHDGADRPAAGAPAAINSRFAAPEPDPPR